MQPTTIGWCTHAVNPIRARRATATDNRSGHYCEKIGPECKFCYSSAMQPRLFGLPEFQEQRSMTGLDLFLDRRKLAGVRQHRQPAALFWCDMTDLFGAWVPDAWLEECFATMEATPWITHLLLTKRAQRLQAWMSAHYPTPLPHIWCGVTAGCQASADTLIPWLMQTPAAGRFLSIEPLLGPLTVGKLGPWHDPRRPCAVEVYPLLGCMAIPDHDWDVGKIAGVILGGESGGKRRPMELSWLAGVVAECQAERVRVYVKQDVALRPGQPGRIPEVLWALKETPWRLP